jgi:hypothetical protein
MKNAFLLIGLFLLLGISAYAKPYGTYQEIVQAAQADQEPVYIGELMRGFAQELKQFARVQEIASPTHYLLFFVNVAGVIGGLRHIVLTGASHRHPQGNIWNAGWTSAWKSADDLLYHASRDVAYLSTPDARYAMEQLLWNGGSLTDAWNASADEASELAKKAMQLAETPEIKGRLAYRISEWKALNFMMTHAQALLRASHDAAKTHLYPRIEPNPFENRKSWVQFNHSWFDAVNVEPAMYVLPILGVFDALVR